MPENLHGNTNTNTNAEQSGWSVGCIVAKKWEPGNPVLSRFSGQISKTEARLRKLTKIRKVEAS